jgi:hypothetical protein
MSNIDVFNRVVAVVFKQLYEAFPKPICISAGDIRLAAEIADEDWWEETRGLKGNTAGAAVIWLHDEGFIRYVSTTGSGTQFAAVVLTSKGFAALNRTPDALEPKPTVGERLKDLSKTATSEFVNGLVKVALSQLQ